MKSLFVELKLTFHWNVVLQPISVTDQEIVEMILFPIVNEACRVLEDGVVVRASDLDIASVLGMSFPSYRYASSLVVFFSSMKRRTGASTLKDTSSALKIVLIVHTIAPYPYEIPFL